jgi:hypothetical protein
MPAKEQQGAPLALEVAASDEGLTADADLPYEAGHTSSLFSRHDGQTQKRAVIL